MPEVTPPVSDPSLQDAIRSRKETAGGLRGAAVRSTVRDPIEGGGA